MSKVTDNVELDFPARMSDGRQFTDYRQNCLMNNQLTGYKGSWIDRQYLINQADEIHAKFMSVEKQNTQCTTCTDNTVLPVKTVVNCAPTGCTFAVHDPKGLGLGSSH